MRRRSTIKKMIMAKAAKIKKIETEIVELEKESLLLSDKNQWFVEKEEEVLICGRPKKFETRLLGRVHWKEAFIGHDFPDEKPIFIERSQVVRVNGEWNCFD